MPRSVVGQEINKYIEINNQDSTTYNITNLVYKLPGIVNQLLNVIGNDVVLKGFDVSSSIDGDNFIVSVDPGMVIEDTTLIEATNPAEVILDGLSGLDTDNKIVVYLEFQYLQTGSLNKFKYGVTSVSTTGQSADGWDHNKKRIVLDIFEYDGTSWIVTDEDTIEIHGELYYKNGFCYKNVSLFKYVNYILSQNPNIGGTGGTSIAPDDDLIIQDLQLNGSLNSHGEDNYFENGVVINGTLDVNDIVKFSGHRLLANVNDFATASKFLELNRNETDDTVGVVNDIGEPTIAGIRVDRGSAEQAAILYFDESDDTWKIGLEGGAIATINSDGTSIPDHSHSYADITDWLSAFATSFSERISAINADYIVDGDTNKYLSHDNLITYLLAILKPSTGISWNLTGDDSTGRTITPNLKLVAGDNVSITTENGNIIISSTATSTGGETISWPITDEQHGNLTDPGLHALVTETSHGFMSSNDKIRLNGILDDYDGNTFLTATQSTRLSELWAEYQAGNFTFTLTPATPSSLGGVIIGSGLNVQSDGTISHPSTHNASIIVEDSDHRFVTDVQIDNWNSKLDSPLTDARHGNLGGGALHANATSSLAGFMSSTDKVHMDQLWAEYDAGNLNGDGSGVALIVKDEGTVLTSAATTINFVGGDVQATSAGQEITVYIPSSGMVEYSSVFNDDTGATNGVVSDITYVSRYISGPTIEGTPFYVGTMTPGTLQPVINTSLITYTTPEAVNFVDDTTTITVEVQYVDGTTSSTNVASSFTTSAINGTGTYASTDNAFIVDITGWVSENDQYAASVQVQINMDIAYPTGGNFNIKITHSNGSKGNLVKLQSGLFYDAELVESSIGSVTVTPNASPTKYISGLKYFKLGDLINITVNDIDNINNLSYPETVVELVATDLGISSTISLAAADLTNWTYVFNNTGASYTQNVSITQSDYRAITTGAIAKARTNDWAYSSYVSSDSLSILIDTYDVSSTDAVENFEDESYRLSYDGSSYSTWDSTSILTQSDLLIINGTLTRQFGNWSTYLPENTAIYTANTVDQTYIRSYKDDTVSHYHGVFDIGGVTEADITNGLIQIEISYDGSSWWDCTKDYTGVAGQLYCRYDSEAYKIDGDGLAVLMPFEGANCTLSTTGPDGWGIYFRITLPNGSDLEITHVRFQWDIPGI